MWPQKWDTEYLHYAQLRKKILQKFFESCLFRYGQCYRQMVIHKEKCELWQKLNEWNCIIFQKGDVLLFICYVPIKSHLEGWRNLWEYLQYISALDICAGQIHVVRFVGTFWTMMSDYGLQCFLNGSHVLIYRLY